MGRGANRPGARGRERVNDLTWVVIVIGVAMFIFVSQPSYLPLPPLVVTWLEHLADFAPRAFSRLFVRGVDVLSLVWAQKFLMSK